VEALSLEYLDALAGALRPLVEEFIRDEPASDAQSAVMRDEALLDELGAGARNASLLRLWSGPAALVAPRPFARKPGFAAAVAESPIPVALRASGGTVVLHGPAFINITHILTRPKGSDLNVDILYAAFGEVLFGALAQLGVAAGFQRVSRAYCNGRHDVAVAGRKLAGTAAMVRRCAAFDAHLVHATLRLTPVPGEIAAITDFERKLGLSPAYEERSLTSLAEELEGR
jgi:lipoate-protein ligase A